MIGQRIESRASPSVGVWFWTVAALGFGGLALAKGQGGWGLISLLCLSFAAGLWLGRPRRFVATLAESGLVVEGLPAPILYTDLQGLKAPRRPIDPRQPGPAHYPILMPYSSGCLYIPAALNVPSDDLFRFLLARMPVSGSRAVNPLLHDHLAKQEAQYGPDRVLSFRARAHLGQGPRKRRRCAVALATALCGVAWIVLAITFGGHEAFAGLGTLLIIVGLFLFFVFLVDRGDVPRVANWKQASLIVGPGGLALVQSESRGEMQWNELQDVKFFPKGRLFETDTRARKGIVLQFEGAALVIMDIYDRPLFMIHEIIRAHWRPSIPQ